LRRASFYLRRNTLLVSPTVPTDIAKLGPQYGRANQVMEKGTAFDKEGEAKLNGYE